MIEAAKKDFVPIPASNLASCMESHSRSGIAKNLAGWLQTCPSLLCHARVLTNRKLNPFYIVEAGDLVKNPKSVTARKSPRICSLRLVDIRIHLSTVHFLERASFDLEILTKPTDRDFYDAIKVDFLNQYH